MAKISAVILTKNEAKNTEACLQSLQWCDEIIIIDDFSSDQTVSLAQKAGASVFKHHLNNNFSQQRNFGLKKAAGPWVLFVDADERVTKALQKEILEVINRNTSEEAVRPPSEESLPSRNHRKVSPPRWTNVLLGRWHEARCYNGFYFKRQDWLWGQKLKHGETARVKLLRLGQKSAGQWQRAVHETWQIKGQTGKLKNPIHHYPHPNLTSFLNHVNFHSTLHAQALKKEGVKPSLLRIILNPLAKFGQNYFLRLGFLDALPGLTVALMMSLHSFLAQAKLYHETKLK